MDFVLLEFILEETAQELYKPFIHIISRFFLYVEVLYYFGEQFAAGGCCYWGFAGFTSVRFFPANRRRGALQIVALRCVLFILVGKRQFVLILSSHSSLI